jgi:hypothetical protein
MYCMGVWELNLIEVVLLWAQSLQAWLGKQGILLEFGQSQGDRPKRSCWVNLRQGDREAELLLWESGEAEFNSSDPITGVIQVHHELGNLDDLALVLGKLLSSVG